MAEPFAILDVDFLILRSISLGFLYSEFIPTSITVTLLLACFARTHTPVIPLSIFMDCANVTDCGAEATPSS